MHVLQLSFFVDPQGRAAQQLLVDWHSLADIAACAASSGVRVSVVQANSRAEHLERDGIEFHFVPPDGAGAPLTSSGSFARLLHELDPDVIHVHGLSFSRELLGLRELSPQVPILLQDHADRLPHFWRRGLWKRAVAAVDGVTFCARQQARVFQAAGLFAPQLKVFEIPESTSTFTPGDREAARAATGLKGDPCILWVGHLDHNKDPLTVLDGVSAAAAELPGLELWCCFGDAPLLPEVQARIAQDAVLRERVHLLGRVPHERIEQLMRAADLFVHGSHRESSSFATIEAIATGLVPVVSDIPSLRALTGEGSVGALWPPGDAAALANALRRAAGLRPAITRARVRAHFERELSRGALGDKLRAAYESLVREPSRAAH